MAWDSAFEVLSEEECLRLLSKVDYGRVVVVGDDGRPQISLIRFGLWDRTVVFNSRSAALVARAAFGHVALEADSIDPMTHEGWDVVVGGVGTDITDSVDSASIAARGALGEHWVGGKEHRWVSIVNPVFRGRRLYVPVQSPKYL